MIAVTIRTAKITAFVQVIPRDLGICSARSSFWRPHDLEAGRRYGACGRVPARRMAHPAPGRR